jgi:hypothetical protein
VLYRMMECMLIKHRNKSRLLCRATRLSVRHLWKFRFRSCWSSDVITCVGRKDTRKRISIRQSAELTLYSDAKIANRNVKVWHGATENGPCMMDTSQTFAACV